MEPKRVQTAATSRFDLAGVEPDRAWDFSEGQNEEGADPHPDLNAAASSLASLLSVSLRGPLGNPLLIGREAPAPKAYLPPDIDAVLAAKGFSTDMSRVEADRKIRKLLDTYYNGEMGKFQADFEKFYRTVVNTTLRDPNPVGDLSAVDRRHTSSFGLVVPPPGAYAGGEGNLWKHRSDVPSKEVFFREQFYCLVVKSIEEMGVSNEIPDHDDFVTFIEDWVRDLHNLPPWGLIDLNLPQETSDPGNSSWYYGLYTGHNDDLSLDGRIKIPAVYAMIALADPKLRPHLGVVILHEVLHALTDRLMMEGILPAEMQSLPAGMRPDASDTRLDTVEHLVIYSMHPFLEYLLDQFPNRPRRKPL